MEIIKLHPPIVHFAIAIPFLLLLVDIYYRLRGKELDELHALLSHICVVSVIGAWVSGSIAKEFAEELLGEDKVVELHGALGSVLVVLFLTLGIFRFILNKRQKLRNFYTALLFVGVLLLFFQGMLGGRIVYDHLLNANPEHIMHDEYHDED